MEIAGKKIIVIGLGRTGEATARFLALRGGLVTVTDMAGEEKHKDAMDRLKDLSITWNLGYHDEKAFEEADLIVTSPGVPQTIAPIKAAKKKNVPVIGEIELASRFLVQPIIGITGTNGKTTTTTLTGNMLEHSGLRVFVGGNIGVPLIEESESTIPCDVAVVELSSFQLDTTINFRPDVAVLLNVSDDHLDRYEGFEGYLYSKAGIFKNQKETDLAVINGCDENILKLNENISARKQYFASPEEGSGTKHCEIKENSILISPPGKEAFSIDLAKTSLKGRHNQENIAAAALAALEVGATSSGIQKAVDLFTTLPHRIEFVECINGVSYFDDSKGTNVDAVARAVESFSSVVLIMGGREKDCDYDSLKPIIRKRVKKLILIGEAQENINNAIGGETETIFAGSMEEAVKLASEGSIEGDTVLLSPACASFDMFDNYNHRGDVFKAEVRKLKTATQG